jgi:mevalonate kinase
MKEGSSCGKFILLGEHSILHQGRAIAFPLAGTKLLYRESSAPETSLHVNGEKRNAQDLANILRLRERLVGAKDSGLALQVETTIPVGAGLGSSAALCSSILRAHDVTEAHHLAERAFRGEEVFHGRPSGVDPYTIAFERILYYATEPRRFEVLSEAPLEREQLALVLLDSGERHRTKEVIAATQALREDNLPRWQGIMNHLGGLAEKAFKFWDEDFAKVGNLMNEAHESLKALGVSDSGLDEMVERARRSGALGAKLTGAGKGGFVLALYRQADLSKRLREEFPTEKFLVWEPSCPKPLSPS